MQMPRQYIYKPTDRYIESERTSLDTGAKLIEEQIEIVMQIPILNEMQLTYIY